LFAGYEWNKNNAIQLSYTYRGKYHWNILTVENDLFAPDVFDRFEANNIQIQTILADWLLKPSVNWNGFVPYLRAGIGISINKIGQVQNIDIPTGGAPLSFNNLLQGKSTTNFAWDVGLGADYYFKNCFSIGLNY